MEKEILTCEVVCTNPEVVNKIKQLMPAAAQVQKAAAIYKALGDPTRFKILYCLQQQEMCVCDISDILHMSQSAISHQLRVLRNLRLVKYRKEGKMVYYNLDDEHIFQILAAGLSHIQHE